ncbi:MAG: hypothetical protein ACOCUI_00370 [bacterium]
MGQIVRNDNSERFIFYSSLYNNQDYNPKSKKIEKRRLTNYANTMLIECPRCTEKRKHMLDNNIKYIKDVHLKCNKCKKDFPLIRAYTFNPS